jgi:type VI secretion system secreted protein VgrG
MAREFVHVRLESERFPCEHVQIHKLAGRETISQLFSFDIGIVCFRPDELDPAAMEGADVTVVFELEGAEIRRIHGMIAEVHDMLDSEPETRAFRIRLVPRAFRLTLIETHGEAFVYASVASFVLPRGETIHGVGVHPDVMV